MLPVENLPVSHDAIAQTAAAPSRPVLLGMAHDTHSLSPFSRLIYMPRMVRHKILDCCRSPRQRGGAQAWCKQGSPFRVSPWPHAHASRLTAGRQAVRIVPDLCCAQVDEAQGSLTPPQSQQRSQHVPPNTSRAGGVRSVQQGPEQSSPTQRLQKPGRTPFGKETQVI